MYTLYSMQRSGNSYKVRLALARLGIPYKLVEIDILQGESRTPEFIAKNPSGQVPLLEVAPGRILRDAPGFPAAYRAEAEGGRRFLDLLRGERELDWTFLSPPAEFEPGERTGTFRLGTDQLLVDANGKSRISMEDYAIAFVDELEAPKHSRQRFTVGY